MMLGAFSDSPVKHVAILGALGAALFAVALWASREESMPVDAEALMASHAGLPEGAELSVRGSIASRFDGTRFDAATRTDTLPDGSTSTRAPGFYDLAAGGFEVASHDAKTHDVTLRAKNVARARATCAAAGMIAPCLLPRVRDLARERLLTESEFEGTLTGAIHPELTAQVVAPRAPLAAWTAFMGGATALLAAVLVAMRAARTSSRSVTKRLARDARSRTASDPTLATVHASIADLMMQAERFEHARIRTHAALAGLQPENEAKLRARIAASSDERDPVRAAAVRELAEIDRVRADARAAREGIERVQATLRTIALASREHRGVRVAAAGDATNEAIDALALRDAASEEVEEMDLRAGQFRV